MTHQNPSLLPPPPSDPAKEQKAPPVGTGPYEPCEECGAPLDPQQRYCVNCAARRANGANPASRYFAAASRRARRPLAPPPAKGTGASRAAAVGFFALLPIAVALGVVVGKSGSGGSDDALIEALREQGPAVASTGAGTAGATTASGKAGNAKGADETGAKVVAETKYGTVHQITNFEPPPEKVKEDTAIVEDIATEGGRDYIETQQHLPDVIVVGGDPSTAPPLPTGAEP